MIPVKVTELNPSYASGKDKRFLILDCPHCRKHAIAIQISGETGEVWEQSGDFETLTLMPSVARIADKTHREAQFIYGAEKDCKFHFWIRGGYVFPVGA